MTPLHRLLDRLTPRFSLLSVGKQDLIVVGSILIAGGALLTGLFVWLL